MTAQRSGPALRSYAPQVGATSSQSWAEQLWNEHGQRVYALAHALLGDETAAMHAVASGMLDLVRLEGAVSPGDIGCALARHVYVRCTASSGVAPRRAGLPPTMEWLDELADLQRASIALCAFGGHTYRCAAEVLGIAPSTVAQLLTSGLAEIGHMMSAGSVTGSRVVTLPAVHVR